MKNVDYIIVGLGIAGLAFAETLRSNNKSFVLFEDANKGATTASGGVLNPTVLKRFTAAWNVEQFLTYAIPFYQRLEAVLSDKVIEPIAIHRILKSVEEQNNWIVACDKDQLKHYLKSDLVSNDNKSISAPYKLGSVNKAYQIRPATLVQDYRIFLASNNCIIADYFDYSLLEIQNDNVVYKDISANHIVFSEGAGVVNNPLFPLAISPELPKVFVPNKGEYIIVNAPLLKCTSVLKGPVMVIPLGNDLYKVGASYGRDELSMDITEDARFDLSDKLKTMITCDFEVVDQVAGIRPTVKDRKPLIGVLPASHNVAFLNGLGTRGLTMAPLLAKQLFDFIENDTEIPSELNLARFL
ncbi:NAD(P)/FAD-dependent oxidoreductase [Patiriisocius marinus]|uniref:FAD-dependent oxidoreductase n=1 Tax=Patiriisocius marinus TaxID=1397112 RepID=A0A5J4IWI5_9FLAO|nr:FAD-dependent oxidoreductase [Patiriisocius marinus]GER58150.1 FAD-dependent oxidoreductase [Patiriisocius marinus]